MKKFKTLMLGAMMVCSFAMLTACGKTPEVTEDDVKDGLKEEKIITKDMDKDSYTIEINDIDLNDDKDKATVEVTVTVTEGYVKYTTDYELQFKINSDKDGWKYRDGKLEKGKTKESLAKGITEEDVKSKLDSGWNSIYVEEANSNLYFGETIKSYEIKDIETDLDEKISTVTIECDAEKGYCTYDFTAELTFKYDYGWTWDSSVVKECKTEYVEGYDMEFEAEDVLKALKDDDRSIYCAGQDFKFGESEVTKFEITDASVENSTAYVNADFAMIFDGDTVEGTVEVYYYFDEDNKEWKYNYLYNSELTKFEPKIVGTWTGTNAEDGVTYKMEITSDKYFEAYCLTAKVSLSDATGTYVYNAKLYYDARIDYNDEFSINLSEWVNEPNDSWSYYTNLYGEMIDGKLVDSWKEIEFTKSE